MFKKIFSLSLVTLSLSVSAAENCKIITIPPGAKTADGRSYTYSDPQVQLVKGNTVLQANSSLTPELTFPEIVSAWAQLVVGGVCPNIPTAGVCEIVPTGLNNFNSNIFGLKYNGGPVFTGGSLDSVVARLNLLIFKNICVKRQAVTPELTPPAPPATEEVPVQTSEETRFD